MPKSYVDGFGRGLLLDLPTAFYLAAAVVAVIWVMQNSPGWAAISLPLAATCRQRLFPACRPGLPYSFLRGLLGSCVGIGTGIHRAARIRPSGDQGSADAGKHCGSRDPGVSIKGGVGRVEMVALGAILLLTLTDAMDLLARSPSRRSFSASSSSLPWRSTSFRNGGPRLSDASISGVSLPPAAEATRHRRTARWGYALLLPLLIVAMELAVSLVEPRVLSLRNIINVLVQSSYLLLFASAQMVVILTGGFDLRWAWPCR